MATRIETSGTALESQWLKDPITVLYELAARMPGQDVEIILNGASYYFFQNARSAQYIWRENADNFDKHFGAFEDFFGQSRMTTDGEEWRRLKAYSQPFITNANPADIIDATVRYFERATDELIDATKANNPVHIDGALDFAAASTVCETALGFPLDLWGKGALDELRAILKYAAVTNWRKLLPSDAAMVKSAENAKSALANRIARLSDTYAVSDANKDLFAVLLAASKEDVDLMGEVCTLLFAGFETTASGLGWAAYVLASAPELQAELADEADHLPHDKLPTLEDLSGMKNLQSFVNETLRLFPPIPLLGRKTVQDDVINGTNVKAGERVFISIVGLHQNANVFLRPNEFNLARFPDGKPREGKAQNFMPFADGKRVCVGARFANTEMLAAIWVILRKLNLQLSNEQTLLFTWEASLRRRGGQKLNVTARTR